MADPDPFLKLIAAPLLPYLETLQRNKLGLANVVPGLSDVYTGSAELRPGKRISDRFKLTIEYAGQPMTWEVMFNFNYPEEPPDFIFNAAEQNFQPEVEEIKSLFHWNADDQNSLWNVLAELLQKYKQHHLKLLSGTLLEYEYNSLVDSTSDGFHYDDFEIYVTQSNGCQRGPVHFLIRLTFQLTSLPDHIKREKGEKSIALLQVTYQSTDGGKVSPRLLLSSHLEHHQDRKVRKKAINSQTVIYMNLKTRILSACGIRPTAVPFPSESCLHDYVLSVKHSIQTSIDSVAISYEKRKELFNSFLVVFEGCVLEYDTFEFRYITFLLTWNDFSFIAAVKLSSRFPAEQPTLILQSIYHVQRSKNVPYVKLYSSYPYSPRWPGNELAQRTRSFIIEMVPEFQRCSVYEGIFCMT